LENRSFFKGKIMIVANKVVSIHYTLTSDAGEILDSSIERAPLEFIQGMGNIIPGLERELDGKKSGEKFNVRLNPENGYGLVNSDMIQTVPMEHFKNIKDLQVGMRFQFNTATGATTILRAIEITPDNVILDGNHPLAGQHLNFAVEVLSVRAATEEELQHGHLHGGAGCCGGGKGGGHCHDNQDDENEEHGHGGCGGGGCC
jgi:FKBP-type peptidyl-prolyl cis-trans isomerase SlyD